MRHAPSPLARDARGNVAVVPVAVVYRALLPVGFLSFCTFAVPSGGLVAWYVRGVGVGFEQPHLRLIFIKNNSPNMWAVAETLKKALEDKEVAWQRRNAEIS